MSIYKKSGVTDFGAEYTTIEETTIYTIKNKEQHEKLVEKINRQVGFSYMEITDCSYPTTVVIDVLELLDIKERYEERTNA